MDTYEGAVKTATLPTKRPVATEPLRFGIDIDGTISQAPHHFRRLIDALLARRNEVYIITGRTERMRRETEELLKNLGIKYTSLVMRRENPRGTVAQYKVQMVQKFGIHMMIDDSAEICWAVEEQTPALAAHMLPIPEMPEALAAKTRLRRAKRPER